MKESATRLLIDGIHRVMDGKYIIGADVANDLAEAVKQVGARAAPTVQADGAGDGYRVGDRRRPEQPPDRRAPVNQPADGEASSDEHLRQNRRIEPPGACAARDPPGRRRFRLVRRLLCGGRDASNRRLGWSRFGSSSVAARLFVPGRFPMRCRPAFPVDVRCFLICLISPRLRTAIGASSVREEQIPNRDSLLGRALPVHNDGVECLTLAEIDKVIRRSFTRVQLGKVFQPLAPRLKVERGDRTHRDLRCRWFAARDTGRPADLPLPRCDAPGSWR